LLGLNAQHRDGSFGRNTLRVTVDETVQHQVANTAHHGCVEAFQRGNQVLPIAHESALIIS